MGALNQAGFNKVALITQAISKKAGQGAR
jgi:hypothetical protein